MHEVLHRWSDWTKVIHQLNGRDEIWIKPILFPQLTLKKLDTLVGIKFLLLCKEKRFLRYNESESLNCSKSQLIESSFHWLGRDIDPKAECSNEREILQIERWLKVYTLRVNELKYMWLMINEHILINNDNQQLRMQDRLNIQLWREDSREGIIQRKND